MEAKTWQKQPLYFVSFADAWPGWTLCRNEKVCSCWLNGGLGCRLALQSWIKNYFRKFSSWAAVLLTTLLCQHVLDPKTPLLTSGNDACMWLESLLSWDGWGTGRSHPRERAVCGCNVVQPWHSQAAAVQVLNKFCSGVLERGRLEHLTWGRTYVWGLLTRVTVSWWKCIPIPACLSSSHHGPTFLFLHHFGCKLPCAVASHPSSPHCFPYHFCSSPITLTTWFLKFSASLEHLLEMGLDPLGHRQALRVVWSVVWVLLPLSVNWMNAQMS